MGKRYKYDENYFEKINTEDKAYFLGFIAADGCIVRRSKNGYMMTLKLHIKDKHIIETFIKCINGEMPLWRHGQRDVVEVHVSGYKFCNDLIRLGIVPKKSLIMEYPKIPKNLERHFLRGYFDGDGCIRIKHDLRDNSKRGDLRIVSGSMKMLNELNDKMSNIFKLRKNKIYGLKTEKAKFIGWSGMCDIENIYHGFYDQSNFFLERKKKIFDEVFNIIKDKIKYRKK